MRLDNSARMNTPGRAAGNWAWRVGGRNLWASLQPQAAELRRLVGVYDRLPKGVEIEL
jgi:4-alpha-glucanotransferase